MVSIVDFSPLDMSNFFRDVMALSRGHPKTFYVYWHEFRDIMITNTRLRVGDSVRNCEENRYGNYERMAYHEYLLFDPKRAMVTSISQITIPGVLDQSN